jgi:hypothetical protein
LRPSLRFLVLAVAGWAGVRAATLGVLPGAGVLSIGRSEARPPPITPTEFPPIEAIAPADASITSAGFMPASVYAPANQADPVARVAAVPVYYYPAAGPAPRPARLTPILPQPAPAFYAPIPPLDEWPLARFASASLPTRQSTVILPGQSLPASLSSNRLDRIRLTAWALLRGRQGAVLGPPSLASAGTLGGSQAGARLSYYVTRQIAATFRTSSDVGRRGGEVAAGVRIQPVGGIPLWFTAERRQQLGRYGGGRNAFALFAEGGIYQRPMPWRFSLDAYFEGGVVGLNRRDRFVDGGLTLTRPVYRQFSAGMGIWGGMQPGLARLDLGPRVTMKVRNNVRVHFDWRQRVAGNAQPGSGPAVTLAGDF